MPSTKLTTASPPAAQTVVRTPHREPGQPGLEIWGQCGKCREWFSADTWFDRTVPTPTCPTCALPPGALRYERGDVPPDSAERILSELWIG